MEPIADVQQALRLLRRYLAHAEATMPEALFERLEGTVDSPSQVDAIVGTAELLYANHGDLDDEGRTITAQLASFSAVNMWHGLSIDNRGGKIAQAMAREMGAEVLPGQPAPQPAEEDPAPKDHLVIAPPSAPPPAPVE